MSCKSSSLDKYIGEFLDFWENCNVNDNYLEHKKAMNIVLKNQGICLNYLYMSMAKKPEAMLPVDFDSGVTLTDFFAGDDAKRFRAYVLIIAKLINSSELAQQLGSIPEIVSKSRRRCIQE